MTREEEIVSKLNNSNNAEIKGPLRFIVGIVVGIGFVAALIFLFWNIFGNGKISAMEIIKFIIPVILIILIMSYMAVHRDKFIKAVLSGEYDASVWKVVDKRKDKKVETYYDRDKGKRKRRTSFICVLTLEQDGQSNDIDIADSIYNDVEVGDYITEISNQYSRQWIVGDYSKQDSYYEGQWNS